jgi:hypothetical protein
MNHNQSENRALTPHQAAQMYGLSVGTLANYRSRGLGPRYYRIPPGGRKVIYCITDIESWLKSNPVLTYYEE